MIKLSPSLLAADALHLADEVRSAEACGCDELHFDVMDGHFVPNLTFGPHILQQIHGISSLVMDVHLMMTDPYSLIPAFAQAGADIITVHYEAADAAKCLSLIRKLGLRAGISLKPGTDVQSAAHLLPFCDRVLLMTVEPGFGGQKLMPDVLKKAAELRTLNFGGDIEADGGITAENAHLLAEAGIQVLVMGTGFFHATDRAEAVRVLHAL